MTSLSFNPGRSRKTFGATVVKPERGLLRGLLGTVTSVRAYWHSELEPYSSR